MMNLFATIIRNFAINTKSCILGEAGFKMNDYLTYFETESSNAQFLCHFDFPFFQFWIILSPCNSFKDAHRGKAQLHKTPVLTKSTNMSIWVVSTQINSF